MVRWVRQGSHVQYGDYWSFIDGFFGPDGGMAVAELTRFQSQHLVSVPLLTYWVNMRLWGGSNITLGLFVVAVALASVGLCWWWIADSERLGDPARAVLAAAIANLALAPHGTWNFVYAMSGTAWWSANLLGLMAITAAGRGRVVPAIAISVVATFTYGTALAAWPAVLAVILVRHRAVRTVVPVAVAGTLTTALYLVLRQRTGHITPGQDGLVSTLSDAATLVGGLLVDEPGPARLIGAAALVALLASTVVAVRADPDDAAPWMALAVFGAGNACLIAHGRGGQALVLGAETVVMHSRYSSIAALTWIALLGSATVAIGRAGPRPLRAIALVVVAAVGLSAAVVSDDDVRPPHQLDELGDALRVDVATGGPWLVFEPFPDLSPLLESIGHHPFDSRYDGGCDLLDTTVTGTATTPVTGEVTTSPVTARREGNLPNGVRVTAWVRRPGWDVECAAVTDGAGDVIGVGRPRDRADDPGTTDIRALAPTGADRYVLVVRFRQSDRLYALPAADAP